MSDETSTLRLRVMDWLDAMDPGRLRLHNASRATMAMFTTWVIVYFITPEMNWYFVGIGIFALLASFICDLVMYQVPSDNRFIALPLVFVPMVIALFLVAWTENSPLWTAVAVILTFYLAYFLRRFGVLYFLLGFTAVTMFYASFLLRVDQTVVDGVIFTIGVAVMVNFVFWFILMPTRPGAAFLRGVRSYNRRGHRILLEAKRTFDEGHMDAGRRKRFDRDMRRLTESRRMIEIQMMDILIPHPSLSASFDRMKSDLFSNERAIGLLVKDIEELSVKGYDPPEDIRNALSDLIGALADWVKNPTSEESRRRISDRLDSLRELIHIYESDGSAKAWILSLGIFYLDGRLLMESVTGFIDNFKSTETKVKERKERKTRILPPRAPRAALPMTTVFGRWKISIPSLMAIQALTAAVIALGVATVLDLSSTVQSFWFALLTVSGSLGATKAKSLSRVVGTLLGLGAGLALGVLANEILFVTVSIVLMLFFIMEFTRTISLNWFILCLVAISIVTLTQIGADPVASAKLLLFSSIIGVAAALLATTILFPIRVRQRYMMAFSGYLATTDLYLRSFYQRVKSGQSLATIEGSNELNQKQMLLEASSKENLYEANPFSSADRESSYDMTTAIKTLHSALVGLRNKQTGARFDEARLDIIDSLIGVISQNIATIRGVLESRGVDGTVLIMNEGNDVMHTLERQDIRWDADEGVTQFRIYLKDLLEVHGIILELGKGIVKERS